MKGVGIPFNRPPMTGKELNNLVESLFSGRLAGDGPFTARCQDWLKQRTGCTKAFLTHSCTAALELAALLLDIQPGDEIIMPSYTFVSTANAFVLRGGVPVFVDVRPDTFNLDETCIASAITSRTRAIVPVHYAGVGCEMDAINAIAQRHGIKVIEDAAQGVLSSYRGRALGSIGDVGTYSFHETKNLTAGEGGALLINDPELCVRAEILWEKGTDRRRYFRGEIDKYTWQDLGSSFLPSELTAAFLLAQFEDADRITEARRTVWQRYHSLLEPLESAGYLQRPQVPGHCQHNAHMYPILLADGFDRQAVLTELQHQGVNAVFHYVPLHSSPAGRRYGRAHGDLHVTDRIAERLIRLPLWDALDEAQKSQVVQALFVAFKENVSVLVPFVSAVSAPSYFLPDGQSDPKVHLNETQAGSFSS